MTSIAHDKIGTLVDVIKTQQKEVAQGTDGDNEKAALLTQYEKALVAGFLYEQNRTDAKANGFLQAVRHLKDTVSETYIRSMEEPTEFPQARISDWGRQIEGALAQVEQRPSDTKLFSSPQPGESEPLHAPIDFLRLKGTQIKQSREKQGANSPATEGKATGGDFLKPHTSPFTRPPEDIAAFAKRNPGGARRRFAADAEHAGEQESEIHPMANITNGGDSPATTQPDEIGQLPRQNPQQSKPIAPRQQGRE